LAAATGQQPNTQDSLNQRQTHHSDYTRSVSYGSLCRHEYKL
jgi:hypothetical protein